MPLSDCRFPQFRISSPPSRAERGFGAVSYTVATINFCLGYVAFLQKFSKTLLEKGNGLLFLLRSWSVTLLEKGKTVNFSFFERKVTKEANQRAVGSLSVTVRKGRKLFAKAHAMRGTFCSAQGCCAAYGSFGSLDLAAVLRIRAGCLCPIADSPNS